MTAGSVIVLAFWVIFTVRKHFTPKLAAAEKANTYDLNRDNPEAKRAAQRRRGPLAAARWALRVAGWAENVLAVLMIAWLAFLLGAILTGTFFVFGYPVQGGAGGEKLKVRKVRRADGGGIDTLPGLHERIRRGGGDRRSGGGITGYCTGAFHHGKHRHEYS